MLWYSDGKLDWDTLYNMPIFLRRFYSKKINKIFREREEAAERRIQHQRAKNVKTPVSPPVYPKSST